VLFVVVPVSSRLFWWVGPATVRVLDALTPSSLVDVPPAQAPPGVQPALWAALVPDAQCIVARTVACLQEALPVSTVITVHSVPSGDAPGTIEHLTVYEAALPQSPSPPNATDEEPRPPVILQHGVLDAAGTWIFLGGASLAAQLVAKGRRVFITNSRGALPNVRVDAARCSHAAFTSFGHMAIFDVPAVIDFVTATANSKTVHWVWMRRRQRQRRMRRRQRQRQHQRLQRQRRRS
jgi:hypothetical protein